MKIILFMVLPVIVLATIKILAVKYSEKQRKEYDVKSIVEDFRHLAD